MRNKFFLAGPITASLIFIALLFPFVFLLGQFNHWTTPDWSELLWALKNTLLQAAGSASLALLLGIIFLQSLVRLKAQLPKSWYKILYLLMQVPGMLPSLFTIIIMLSLLRPFPMGLIGIILVHAMVYAGFIAINLMQFLEDKAQGMIEVSYIIGASKPRILWQVLSMLKWDIFSTWFMVFCVCFTSFAVPLAVGGGWGTTLEVLIYEKIRLSGDYSSALGLSLFQSLLLFLFSLLQRGRGQSNVRREDPTDILGSFWSVLIFVGIYFAFYACFLLNSVKGWQKLIHLGGPAIYDTLSPTLAVGLAAGVICYLLFNLIAFSLDQVWLRKFIMGYVAPSTSLAGLVVVLLSPDSVGLQISFFVLSFISLIFCGLYRMGFEQKLSQIKGQVEVAKILGSSNLLTYRHVVFPQIHALAARLSGTAALWIVGDFALSKIIFSKETVLAQIVQGLIGSYKLDLGMAMMNLVILIGLGLYLVFEVFGRVYRYQSE